MKEEEEMIKRKMMKMTKMMFVDQIFHVELLKMVVKMQIQL